MPKPSPFASLKIRIAALTLLLFVGCIWLLTYLTTNRLQKDLTELLVMQQQSAVSYVAADLEQRVRQRFDALALIAGEITPQLLAQPGRLNELLAHRPLLRSFFTFGVVVIASDGQGVTDYPPMPLRAAASFAQTEEFQQLMASGKPAIGKPRLGRFAAVPVIGFAAPVRDGDGRTIAVLAGYSALSDPAVFGQVESTNVGQTGWISIVSPRHRLIVAHSEAERILQPMANPGVNRMLDRFAAGEEGSGVTINSRGVETLASGKQIPSTGWFAQVALPTGEAFAPIRAMKARAYALAAALSAVVALLVWLLIRQLLKPLNEASERIKAMASGGDWLTPLAVARRDEIGQLQLSFNRLITERNRAQWLVAERTKALEDGQARLSEITAALGEGVFVLDEAGRIRFSNPEMHRLLGYSEAELAGQPARLLFCHTRADNTPCPSAACSLDRAVHAEQTLRSVETFWRKDGTSLPVEVCTSPIVRNGKVAGAVLAFSDISLRQRVEQSLRLSEAKFREILDHAPIGMALCSTDGRWLLVNHALCAMFGYAKAELESLSIPETTYPDDLASSHDFRQDLLEGRLAAYEIEKRYLRKDGSTLWAQLTASLQRDEQGKPLHFIAQIQDISERKKAENELLHAKERLELAVEASALSLWDFDLASGEVYLDEHWARIVGGPAGERFTPVGELWQLVHADDRDRLAAAVMGNVKGLLPDYRAEFRVRTTTGQWRWISGHGRVVERDAKGWALRMTGTNLDISERKQTESTLQQFADEIEDLYQHAPCGYHSVDADGRIIRINDTELRWLGYARDELVGQVRTFDLLIPDSRQAYLDEFSRFKENGGLFELEVGMTRKDGTTLTGLLQATAILDEAGRYLRSRSTLFDITERKQTEELIWRQANYDALTGLPNRRLFRDRLQQELKKSARSGRSTALLFIDLDRFKEVNDTLGHDMGDRLLIEAARRIGNCVRDADTVARLGGDEFTVILPSMSDPHRVEQVAQAIIRSLAETFELGDKRAYISASIGITLYPADAQDAETLIKNADQAMYVAKSLGRNGFSHFTQALQAAAQTRLQLGNDLYDALALDQFELYYQPILDLETGRIVKAEALLRWNHPTRGLVGPLDFIPYAEEIGLIAPIGDWVFRAAAQAARRWNDSGAGPIQVSINKSPRQFASGNTHETWPAFLREIGLPAERLAIEITEGLLLDDRPEIGGKLRDFRNAGIEIALDDFGTGFSALSYLQKFHIDYLKIDRSFIRDMATVPGNQAIAEAIIVMARKLGLKVTAEGVETPAQLALLKAAGCHYGQGYYFARPLPGEEFEALLGRQRETERGFCRSD